MSYATNLLGVIFLLHRRALTHHTVAQRKEGRKEGMFCEIN
jgi:hypothetical protein